MKSRSPIQTATSQVARIFFPFPFFFETMIAMIEDKHINNDRNKNREFFFRLITLLLDESNSSLPVKQCQ